MGSTKRSLLWLGVILFGFTALSCWIAVASKPSTLPMAVIETALALLCYWPIFRDGRAELAATDTYNAQMQAWLGQQLAAIQAGQMPTVQPQRVILRQGERAYFAAAASLLEQHTTGYRRHGSSSHVRITKHISVSSGTVKREAIKEWHVVAQGELAITDKRVVFAGDERSFDLRHAQLTNIEGIQGGQVFHAGNSRHVVHMAEHADSVLSGAVIKVAIYGHQG